MGTHVHGVISFEMTPSQDFAIEKATQTNFLSKLPCSEGLFWIFLCIFWQNSLRHQPLLFRKKVLQKCPKSFQKQGPRTSLCQALMLNLGPLFSGPCKIRQFSSFKSCLLSSMCPPLLSASTKVTFFRDGRTDGHTPSLDCAHGRKGRFAQKYQNA